MQSDYREDILAGRIEPGMSFQEMVWAICTRVPSGRVATYGDLALALGRPRAARAVGQALHNNPFAPDVPCHRVVGSTGDLTGFAGGVAKKRRMLMDEGVLFIRQRVDLARCRVDALAK